MLRDGTSPVAQVFQHEFKVHQELNEKFLQHYNAKKSRKFFFQRFQFHSFSDEFF